MPASLISTRAVRDRYTDVLPACRGNRFFIAPGTTAIYVAGRQITPSDNNDGLTPYGPLATVDQFFSNLTTGRDDQAVFLTHGTYTLTANQASNKNEYQMVSVPGLSPRDVTVVGVTGGTPLDLRGNRIRLRGFSINTADATYGDLTMGGDHCLLEDMALDSNATVVPAWALKVMIPTSVQHATATAFAMRVLRCRLADSVLGLTFDHQVGHNAITVDDFMVADSIFEGNTTRDINQVSTAVSGTVQQVEGLKVFRNNFQGLAGGTDFMTINNQLNGTNKINAIQDNVFGHNAITSTQVILTNTTTRFKFTGNRDKTGFITGV